MPRTDHTVLVMAPLSEVFEYVADYRNVAKFEKRFSRVEPLPGPRYGLGTTLDTRGWFHGVPVRAKLRTTEFVENQRIVSNSISGLKSTLEWEFAEENGGTRVKMAASFDWPLPLIPRHIKEAIQEEVREMTAASLCELKRLLESGDQHRNEVDHGK